MNESMLGMAAVVTGGGSGIGREVCIELAQHGVKVTIADVRLDAAEAVAAELRAGSHAAQGARCDVSSSADARTVVASALEQWRRLDILVNCAGVYQTGPITTISEADWDHMIDINLKGTFLMCKEVVPVMQARRGGAIVNLSSISGRTKPGFAGVNYTASKAGIIGLTMCLASQLAADGIRVNCVAPGTIDTPMTRSGLSDEGREKLRATVPLGRLGMPQDVAAAVVFLASPAAAFITGETLNVNGGAFMV